MQRYTTILVVTALALIVGAVVVWGNVLAHMSGRLTVAFLDVGQGDSIYIESPTGTQVLVDSGANKAVLRQLQKQMPLFDSTLDILLATHPDGDHVGGFPYILERYDVGTVVYQHVAGLSAGPADAFEQSLVKWRLKKEESIPRQESFSQKSPRVASLNQTISSRTFSAGDVQKSFSKTDTESIVTEPHRGDVWDIGGGAYIVVHYPDREGDPKDTNAGSVVVRVVYGSTSFLLTGDSPQEVEEYLVALDGGKENNVLQSDVLKLGHHGSRTSTSPAFLSAVKPAWAIISRGCDNTYGHPHKEVLDLLAGFKIPALDTCTEGTIVFESDGEKVLRK